MYEEGMAVGGGEWKTTRPGRFTPAEEVPVPIEQEATNLGAVVEKKSLPCEEPNPDSPITKSVAYSSYRPAYAGSFIFI
jgi:hypothetical protein